MTGAAAGLAFDALPAPLAEPAAVAWQRCLDAAGAAPPALPDTVAAVLPRVFALSPFVGEVARRQSAAFLALAGSGAIMKPVDAETIAGTLTGTLADTQADTPAAALPAAADDAAQLAGLRRARLLLSARIAWCDLAGTATLEESLAALSSLADQVIQTGARQAMDRLAARYGAPLDAAGTPEAPVVIAMGKLGGAELNFSSDVDLIIFFPDGAPTAGGRRSVERQEYSDRFGRELVRQLSEPTADGIAFRVDLRLRPNGDSGQLTTGFRAARRYYTEHGRDWERYALMKARPLTGRPEQARALMQILRGFVYRRYLDYGVMAAVREMKRLIDREVQRHDRDRNIKLGPGGIREIEFIVQTFQLIRGGRHRSLRRQQLLTVLARLQREEVFAEATCAALRKAYSFLRLSENRLQAMYDRQTHSLPDAADDQLRLTLAMEFDDWDAYVGALSAQRRAVSDIFFALLHRFEITPLASRELVPQDWAGGGLPLLLKRAGFSDVDGAAALLEPLLNPRFLGRFAPMARERFDRLLPNLLLKLGGRADPLPALQRFVKLISAVQGRTVYLTLLAEFPAALERISTLFDASPWIAEQLTRQPILLDETLDEDRLYRPPGRVEVDADLARSLAELDGDDLETQMDTLRTFRQRQVLRVAASEIMETIPLAEISNQLTYVAEAVVREGLNIAWRDLAQRYGEPHCGSGADRRPVGFGVIAYGKFGGMELSYASDLDLVFVHDSSGAEAVTDGAKQIANDVFFQRLTQRLIHVLSTPTAAGVAYDIDIRLRPSGGAGLLVASVEALAQYQRDSAWTWEHQALVRARPVAGAPGCRQAFDAIRREVLCQAREPAPLARDIMEMRERMRGELAPRDEKVFDLKHSAGGITDIEFMVQYAVLRWAHAHPQLVTWTDNLRELESIAQLGLWSGDDCATLHDAYFALRAAIHRSILEGREARAEGTEFAAIREQVRGLWRERLEAAAQ